MEPLLIIKKSSPAYILYRGLFPKKLMIIFAEDAIYVVRIGKDFFSDSLGLATDMIGINALGIGDLIGGKIDDFRQTRKGNKEYKKIVEDVETLISQQKKGVLKLEYTNLKKFIYRKSIRFISKDFIGFQFKNKNYYFFVKDKNVIEPALTIIKELSPNAKIKSKRGPMLKKG